MKPTMNHVALYAGSHTDATDAAESSAARRGLGGLFIASVAETILGGLQRSALVIKRPGFVSPVPSALDAARRKRS